MALLAATTCLFARARADSLGSVDRAVTETSHVVHVRVAGNVAFLDVERSFANAANYDDELTLTIELPAKAAATSLRLEAGPGHWQAAVLLPSEVARGRYDTLSEGRERSDTRPGPPALLEVSDEYDGALALTVYRIPAHGMRRLAYTLVAPLARMDGLRDLGYPAVSPGTRLADPVFRPAPGTPAFTISTQTAGGVHPVNHLRFEGSPDALLARAGALGLPDDQLYRIELDAPRRLSDLPWAVTVIFVVDRSRSEGPAGIAAQLDIVRAYLAAVPSAHFSLVAFDHEAGLPLPKMVAATDAPHVVVPAAVAPGRRNGSELAEALALAGSLMAGVSGETRIVALTDGYLAPRVERALAAVELPPATILHVVQRMRSDASGELSRERDFGDGLTELAELARAHGGMLLRISGSAPDSPALTHLVTELVRPVRIEALTVSAGDSDDAFDLGDLDEGGGLRWNGLAAAPARRFHIAGWLWGRKIERTITASAELDANLPALTVGDVDALDSLEHPEWVATLAGAVSRYTSLVNVAHEARLLPPPGRDSIAPPGLIGLEGTTDCEFGGNRDRIYFYNKILAPILAACQAHAPGALTVAFSLDEIVDVGATGFGDRRACVEEALWAVELPTGVFRYSSVYTLDLPGE